MELPRHIATAASEPRMRGARLDRRRFARRDARCAARIRAKDDAQCRHAEFGRRRARSASRIRGRPARRCCNGCSTGWYASSPANLSPDFIEPDLAESWTSTPDGKEWTFKLRQGVQCHYGYGEFTSEDAAYSLKRASTKESSAFSSDYAAFDKIEARRQIHAQDHAQAAVPEPARHGHELSRRQHGV